MLYEKMFFRTLTKSNDSQNDDDDESRDFCEHENVLQFCCYSHGVTVQPEI
jgi:hypothetical protein